MLVLLKIAVRIRVRGSTWISRSLIRQASYLSIHYQHLGFKLTSTLSIHLARYRELKSKRQELEKQYTERIGMVMVECLDSSTTEFPKVLPSPSPLSSPSTLSSHPLFLPSPPLLLLSSPSAPHHRSHLHRSCTYTTTDR